MGQYEIEPKNSRSVIYGISDLALFMEYLVLPMEKDGWKIVYVKYAQFQEHILFLFSRLRLPRMRGRESGCSSLDPPRKSPPPQPGPPPPFILPRPAALTELEWPTTIIIIS